MIELLNVVAIIVAGLMVGKVLPSLAATQWPPIKHWVYLISAGAAVSVAVAMICLPMKRKRLKKTENVRQRIGRGTDRRPI